MSRVRRALYAGSFDPITLGHVDIIQRVSLHFDEVIVLVAESQKKTYLFNSQERASMVTDSLAHLPNIRVAVGSGLTVEFARKNEVSALVRGLRTVSDFDAEMAMAEVNSKLGQSLETFLVFASPEYRCISSHLVKEVAQLGGSLEELLPVNVQKKLKEKLCNYQPAPRA